MLDETSLRYSHLIPLYVLNRSHLWPSPCRRFSATGVASCEGCVGHQAIAGQINLK